MGSGNLTFTGGANATFAGAVTGTGGVIVTGASSEALTGTPSYIGATTISTGTLSVSSSSSSTIGSANKDVTIAPGLHDVGTFNVGMESRSLRETFWSVQSIRRRPLAEQER